jgi:hypothetical protein
MIGIGLVLVVLLIIELAALAPRVRRDGQAVQSPSADLLVRRWRSALPHLELAGPRDLLLGVEEVGGEGGSPT